MAGFIYSETQAKIYDFLERVGPCPAPALAVLFGDKTTRHLFHLRRQGYVYNLALGGIEFWIPQDYGRFNPRRQEVAAWFAVRIIESGGTIEGQVGISPGGVTLLLTPAKDRMMIESGGRNYEALLEHLKEKPMKECLKAV